MVYAAAAPAAPGSRREIVERVLATADALERAACARARAPRLVIETRAGCVAVEGRLCAVVGRGAAARCRSGPSRHRRHDHGWRGRLDSVGGFAHNFEGGLVFESGAQTFTHDGVIIGQEYADFLHDGFPYLLDA